MAATWRKPCLVPAAIGLSHLPLLIGARRKCDMAAGSAIWCYEKFPLPLGVSFVWGSAQATTTTTTTNYETCSYIYKDCDKGKFFMLQITLSRFMLYETN
jgi:hypothetical protein